MINFVFVHRSRCVSLFVVSIDHSICKYFFVFDLWEGLRPKKEITNELVLELQFQRHQRLQHEKFVNIYM
jgi:hypothetical protein